MLLTDWKCWWDADFFWKIGQLSQAAGQDSGYSIDLRSYSAPPGRPLGICGVGNTSSSLVGGEALLALYLISGKQVTTEFSRARHRQSPGLRTARQPAVAKPQ